MASMDEDEQNRLDYLQLHVEDYKELRKKKRQNSSKDSFQLWDPDTITLEEYRRNHGQLE